MKILSSVFITCFCMLQLIAFGQKTLQTNEGTAILKVYGTCALCKTRIEKSLKIPGIYKAQWNIATQLLNVNYDTLLVTADHIHDRMIALGHDTELKTAAKDLYEALPECCLYRDPAVNEIHDTSPAEEDQVRGIILTEDNKGNLRPLAGANVVWLHSGNGTTTDQHGVFLVKSLTDSSTLVISYAGYQEQKLLVSGKEDLQIMMHANGNLSEVRIIARQRSTSVNMSSAFRVTTLSSRELLKAACCNLSESFETNPSVDVTYSDAVSGSKQIQLLGLSGIYTQLTVENLPGPRGIATHMGLNSIAGPWIESIQLSKGTGSVVNGFESIAGQINVELKKPENSEKLYLNGYINSMGKTDFNLNLSKKINDHWSTTLLLHDDFLYRKTDFNQDGFRDLPTGNQFSAINRWRYDNEKGFMLQLGAKLWMDDKTGGTMSYEEKNKFSNDVYGLGIKTNRYEGFAKIAYTFPEKKYRSIGLQLSAIKYEQDAYFGARIYDAKQDNLYANLIYQDIIGNTNHKYRTGLSASSDAYNEIFEQLLYERKEIVPGAFFEYTYTQTEKFSLVAGIRGDHNNLYGWFATPRLNLKYQPHKNTSIRLSAGRGQRTANIFAENMGSLVSSRKLNIIPGHTDKAYGLNPEVAWNKGISIDQKFRLFKHDAMFSIDFFRNDFTSQVVTDLENPRQLNFYNLNGKSFANSLQAELEFTPAKQFDIRMAYRWFDVKTTYGEKLLQKPLTAKHRAFANIAYEIKGWKMDYTINYTGQKRIPSTGANLLAFRMPAYSKGFVTMNAQISKPIGKSKAWELYAGAENLTGFMQEQNIIAANEPFSPYFDASLIWGPVSERVIYTGFRFKIK